MKEKVTNETHTSPKVTNETHNMGNLTNETPLLFVGESVGRSPKSQIRMAESPAESDLVSEAHDTESDSEEEAPVVKKGKTPRVIPAGATAQYAARIRQQERQKHRLSKERLARTLDQDAEKEALDAGKLQPRPLSVLSTVENVVHVGQKFTCREDLLVRVAEDCEKKHKFFMARNPAGGGHTTKAGRPVTSSQYVNAVCRDDKECTYSVKASFSENRGDDGGMCWVVDEYMPHTCQGGAPQKRPAAPATLEREGQTNQKRYFQSGSTEEDVCLQP